MATSAEKTGNATMTDTDGRDRTEPDAAPAKASKAETKGKTFLVRVRPPTNEFRMGDHVVTREGIEVDEGTKDAMLKGAFGGAELYVSEVN